MPSVSLSVLSSSWLLEVAPSPAASSWRLPRKGRCSSSWLVGSFTAGGLLLPDLRLRLPLEFLAKDMALFCTTCASLSRSVSLFNLRFLLLVGSGVFSRVCRRGNCKVVRIVPAPMMIERTVLSSYERTSGEIVSGIFLLCWPVKTIGCEELRTCIFMLLILIT
jgi:hypothetical protein